MSNRDKIVKILIQKGKKLFNQKPPPPVDFFQDKDKIKGIVRNDEIEKANKLLNDFKKYPHAFVLACIMDKQMNAEKAWLIPYEVIKGFGSFDFSRLFQLKYEKIKKIFQKKKLGRFWKNKAKEFYLAVQKIERRYDGNASKIWEGNPTSCIVVRRFLDFKGVGKKIATMATNILARDFKIKMKDLHCIDISPDVHVNRVFKRLGLVPEDTSNDELMYCARELNPEYPGIFDLSCWKIGRNWCHPRNPDCSNCYLNQYCPKIIKNLGWILQRGWVSLM